MVYGGFMDLPRRAAADKLWRYKTFNIARNPSYDGYQYDGNMHLFQWFINFLIRRLQIVVLKLKLCRASVL